MRKLLTDRVGLIRAMQRAMEKARLNGDGAALQRIIMAIRADEGGQFLSYSQECPDKVSYAPKPDARHENTKRMRTSLGRYIRRQLGAGEEELSSDGLLRITRCVFAHLVEAGVEGDIRIIGGDEITNAYKRAIGGGSCMTGSCCEYVGLYAMNPGKVRMVLYGRDYARALLWKCDDGARVLDRIYPNDGPHVDVLHQWAMGRGFAHRCHNHLPNGNVELSDGSYRIVTLRHNYVFPYLDTFHYGRINSGEVSLSNEASYGEYRFESTGGGHGNDDYIHCHHCNGRISEDEAWHAYDNDYCEDCYSVLYVSCGKCGDVVANDDAIHVKDIDQDWCQYCADNHAHCCECCKATATEGGSVEDQWWCVDCMDNHASCCCECEGYYASEISLHECDDGEARCENCAEECECCGVWFEVGNIQKGECEECRESEAQERIEAEEEAELAVG